MLKDYSPAERTQSYLRLPGDAVIGLWNSVEAVVPECVVSRRTVRPGVELLKARLRGYSFSSRSVVERARYVIYISFCVVTLHGDVYCL